VPRETELSECPNLLQLRSAIGESPHSASYRGCSLAKQELQRRRNLRAKASASNYATPDRAVSSALCRSEQQPSQKMATDFKKKNTHQDTNQISGQSVQAKNVNINATDLVFLAFTTVQQTMTKLSGVATEKEKVAVITEDVLRLLKNITNNSS
jgi:delta 1-pyrroline-5-carboxylate dehydrogenase